ncbi:hypothetical protein VDG1235_4767 [Verrucomicrobiia bacterium DG1235]|nr:hypothetical protein VDG1235_4767 [Verrucomicrobiae bacterium DG1235]
MRKGIRSEGRLGFGGALFSFFHMMVGMAKIFERSLIELQKPIKKPMLVFRQMLKTLVQLAGSGSLILRRLTRSAKDFLLLLEIAVRVGVSYWRESVV